MNSSFSNRYKRNDCVNVWEEIDQLKEKAFSKEYKEDISEVLQETMRRVKYNVDLIYARLLEKGYQFELEPYKRVLPPPNKKELLTRLNQKVNQMGFYIPESLQQFYEIVGGVAFIERKNKDGLSYADPLVVFDLETQLKEVESAYWEEDIQLYIEEDQIMFLEIAPDVYHKDGVSGGPPYCVQMLEYPSIDSKLLNEAHKTTFINYLRICFEWGGFLNIKENNTNYEAFISALKEDLLEI